MHNVFGWSLPPGVTLRDIDDAYSGRYDTWADRAVRLHSRIEARLGFDTELGRIETIHAETPYEKFLARVYWSLWEALTPDPQTW